MRLILTTLLAPATAPCGGDFTAAMAGKVLSAGLSDDSVKSSFNGARPNPAVSKADRSQGVFPKTFLDLAKPYRKIPPAAAPRRSAANRSAVKGLDAL